MSNSKNEKENIYKKRAWLILSFVLVSITIFLIYLLFVLRGNARNLQDSENARYVNTTIANLDNNEKELNKLETSYHENLKMIMNDFVSAFEGNAYAGISQLSVSEKCKVYDDSIATISNCSFIFVTDKSGNIYAANYSSYVDHNIFDIEELEIDKKILGDLYDLKSDYLIIKNSYYEDELAEDYPYDRLGKEIYLYCSRIKNTTENGQPIYVIVGFGSYVLDQAEESMHNVSTWINGTVAGKNVSLLFVDKNTNVVKYGVVNEREYYDTDISDFEFSKNILDGAKKGKCKRDGISYYYDIYDYSSDFYGDNCCFVTLVPTRNVYGGIFAIVLWIICLLLIIILLLVAFASFLRSDSIKNGVDLKRIRLFSIKDNTYYYSKTLGEKVIPVAIFALVIVFSACFYIQSLLKLSDAFVESVSVENDIAQRLEVNNGLQEYFLEHYNMQNLSKARLLSFITSFHSNKYLYFDEKVGNVNTIGNINDNGKRSNVTDQYNNVAYVISSADNLIKLCEKNNLKDIYIYNDSGHVIATSSTLWNFTLSTNPKDQSYEFWDIVNGVKDYYIQNPRISDEGIYSQFIGTAYNYYTCLDDNGNTEYVDYSSYLKQINGTWNGNPITKHRGLIQIELKAENIGNIIESTSTEYVLKNTKISNDGFLFAFYANEDIDDYEVVYSPIEKLNGQTATELGISSLDFADEYNGFQMMNGEDYLECFKKLDKYIIVTAIPTTKLYAYGIRTAYICTVFTAIILLFLSFYTTIVSDMDSIEIYNESNDPFAIFGHFKSNKKWKKQSSSQKFEWIIKNSIIVLGAVFLLAIVFEEYRYGENSVLYFILNGNWNYGFHIFSFTACLIILILSGIIIRFIGRVLKSIASAFGSRVETVMGLFTALLKATLFIFVCFYCMYLFGIDARNLLASAGIISVVVGLGAQNLISDILVGIFIVMEGTLHVGDYIYFEDFRGKITEIGLRTTKFEDTKQNVKIVSNSSFKSLINMSKKYTFIEMEVPIPYGESVDRVRDILNEEFVQLYSENRFLKGIPVCQGVQEFGESSLNVRVRILCDENDRMDVQRFMNDQIVRIFKENNITIPFNQLDIHTDVIKFDNRQ